MRRCTRSGRCRQVNDPARVAEVSSGPPNDHTQHDAMSLSRIPRKPTGGRISEFIRWAVFKPEANLPREQPPTSGDAMLPTVNRPGKQIRHFPKALDPDRSFAYSKKIEKFRKPTHIGYRIWAVCAFLGGLGESDDCSGVRGRWTAELSSS
jgi:hypothetical protein